jgi:hypothetical protein
MKLLMAILAYLLIAVVLGWGILAAAKGNPWILIAGFIVYAVAFAKIGCLPKKSH